MINDEKYVLEQWKFGRGICPYCGSTDVSCIGWSDDDAHMEDWGCDSCDKGFQIYLEVAEVIPTEDED